VADIRNDNTDDEKQDLLATLAAARDLSPDMDRALVDSYLEKRKAASGGTQQAIVAQTGNRSAEVVERIGSLVIGVGVIAAFIAIMIASHGAFWWLFFPMMGIGFGGWHRFWHSDEEEQAHEQRHIERDRMRHERRMARMGYYTPRQPDSLPQQPNANASSLPPAPPRSSTPSSYGTNTTSTGHMSGSDSPPINPAG
jgi:hypothetical protein